jgi:hypothetical protein
MEDDRKIARSAGPPTPVFANSINYFVSATDLVFEFGFGLPAPNDPALGITSVMHTRVVLGADIIEPLIEALNALIVSRNEARRAAVPAVEEKKKEHI